MISDSLYNILINANRTLDFISPLGKRDDAQMSSQHSVYEQVLSQLDQEFGLRLCTSRIGDVFVTDDRRLSTILEEWKCIEKDSWIILMVQPLSIIQGGMEDCIVSVQINITQFIPCTPDNERSNFLDTIVSETKKSCHSINQDNLLQMLHDRKVSSVYLMYLKSESNEDSQLSQQKPEASAISQSTTNEILSYEQTCYSKDMFYPGCFSCERVDEITCSIQEFYDSSGQNSVQNVRDAVVNGLISSFFHPFAVANSKEHCFVFRVSV